MLIAEFSIKCLISDFMVIPVVCIFWIIAFSRLELDMLPEIKCPAIPIMP
jgi:multidrug efflux pump subunit AcrB